MDTKALTAIVAGIIYGTAQTEDSGTTIDHAVKVAQRIVDQVLAE